MLVIMTGASGSGKTAIAEAIERTEPSIAVFCFDTIGVPSAEIMATYGSDHQPGGAWQRAMTIDWMERIAPVVDSGRPVLFEGQMRVAFIREALEASKIENATMICVDCDDSTRTTRLTHFRLQPELANGDMMIWGRFLRQEAIEAGCHVLDTSNLTLDESVRAVLSYFESQEFYSE